MKNPFDQFLIKFAESFKKSNQRIRGVMANVFSMRVVGNKTHGDLAEVALTEYINEFVDGYTAQHTGKEKFRAKLYEEDISVTNQATKEKIPISIKAYGAGPLQLSTNKEGTMFLYLSKVVGKKNMTNVREIKKILANPCFVNLSKVNVLPLIYNEKNKTFKIIIFDLGKAYATVRRIKYFPPRKYGKNKKTFPIYKFFDKNGQYIFEVRYGDAKANALQRGLWTHTENAKPFFKEILSGPYEINEPLLDLISKILVASKEEHKKILKLFP
ncbi:MAG: hypothetical protein ACTSUC_03355 [Promethearchaeota archaeon]